MQAHITKTIKINLDSPPSTRIPHGSTNHSSCSTCPQIPKHWEMKQLCCAPKFKLDTQEIVYNVDMFRDTLNLPVETRDNPFVAPATIKIIESFMQRVGYQGVVDKVSAFYTKFLAQPWQTMFKVFNRCLTTRTSGHDQTKINILQLFHVVVNQINVNYVALLWWDFMNCVFHKKGVIQYPHFTKIIIIDLMKKYPSISPRLEEYYHSIMDDISLVSVYTTGNVTVRGVLILDAFLTEEIRATDHYKEYETVSVNVVVLMNQPQSVVSTQGTHRKKKQSNTPIPPPGDDKERDEMAEATLLSLTLYKIALAAKAQENIAKVQEKLDEEEIEKMVKGEEDEESYASEFADSMFNDVDDSGTRIEPRSHKENPEGVDDDDGTKMKNDKKDEDEVKDDDIEKTDDAAKEKDNDDHTDHTLVGTYAMGSLDTRNEQMPTL
ncbi:hypothetical protein Tco_0923180 [Tanacetum coccineum]|uniref:Uncharacterized protein n=1 Tax=Tanacetum coccineum TaxID=301880 RepID=A0ABQ5D3J6_9ASTR